MKDTAQTALLVGLRAIWTGDPANMPEGVAIVDTSLGPRIVFSHAADDLKLAQELREKFAAVRQHSKLIRHVEHYSRTGKLPPGISRIKKDDQQ